MKILMKIVVRICALFFGYKVLTVITNFITFLGSSIDMTVNYNGLAFWYFIITFIIYSVTGIILWIFSEQIAGFLVQDKDGSLNLQIDITYRQLMNMVLKILGIILVLNSLEPISLQILNIYNTHINIIYTPQRAYYIISLLNPVIKLVVGIVLILKKMKEKPSIENV